MFIPIRTSFLMCIIWLYSFAVSAQSSQEIDSLKHVFKTHLSDTNKIYTLIKLSYCYQMYYPDSGITYAQQALVIAEKLKYDEGIFWSMAAKNASLTFTGNYPLELEYAFKALSLSKKINKPSCTGFANGMLSDYYYDVGEYSTSLKYWLEVVKIIKRYFPNEMYNAFSNLARIYDGMNQSDSTMYYAKKTYALVTHHEHPNKYEVRAALLICTTLGNAFASKFSDIYALRNKLNSTLKYLRMSVALKDSLFNREKMLAIHNLTYIEQEKQNEIRSAEIKLKNRFTLYLLLAVFVSLSVITGIVFKNRRHTELQKMRNTIADDLHDDIGSTLSSINIMSELAKTKSSDTLSLLESIGESTITIQENMSDIVWAIKSVNERFENVFQRMNQFASDILDAKNIEFDFKGDKTLSSSKLSMEQRKNVYLFFKEVVNNAVKYSETKKISIWFAQKGKYAEICIQDHGKGFDTVEISNGNGMTSLKKRAAALKGKLTITSKPNEGTFVELKFNIT